MYDIAYCKLENCKDWTCEKSDNCKRNLERKDIPEDCQYHLMNVFNICKEQNYSLYIPYNKEKKE